MQINYRERTPQSSQKWHSPWPASLARANAERQPMPTVRRGSSRAGNDGKNTPHRAQHEDAGKTEIKKPPFQHQAQRQPYPTARWRSIDKRAHLGRLTAAQKPVGATAKV